jgi:hypothetical protein
MFDDIVTRLLAYMGRSAEPPREITPDDVRKAVETLKNAKPYDPCVIGHVLSPASYAKGYGVCANCFTPVGDWSKAITND